MTWRNKWLLIGALLGILVGFLVSYAVARPRGPVYQVIPPAFDRTRPLFDREMPVIVQWCDEGGQSYVGKRAAIICLGARP